MNHRQARSLRVLCTGSVCFMKFFLRTICRIGQRLMAPRINFTWRDKAMSHTSFTLDSHSLLSLPESFSPVQPFLVYFLYHPQPIQSADVVVNHMSFSNSSTHTLLVASKKAYTIFAIIIQVTHYSAHPYTFASKLFHKCPSIFACGHYKCTAGLTNSIPVHVRMRAE